MRVIGGCCTRWISDGKIEALAGLPRRQQDRRQQNVLAALQRIALDTPMSASTLETAVCTRSRQQLGIADWRAFERGQDGNRHTRGAARRVQRELRGVTKTLDASAVFAPLRQPVLPQRLPAAAANSAGDFPARLASSSLIHGAKSSGRRFGKRQQQVGEIALGIDHDDRNAVDGRFLDRPQCRGRFCRCRSCRRTARGSPGPWSRKAPGLA